MVKVVDAAEAARTGKPQLGLAIEYRNGTAVVSGVRQDSPADQAGVQPGDVLSTIDGKQISDGRDAVRALTGLQWGGKVQLGLRRSGQDLRIEVACK
jgi:S1-C subfamily serine protease